MVLVGNNKQWFILLTNVLHSHLAISAFCLLKAARRHDSHHDDIQYNDTMHCDIYQCNFTYNSALTVCHKVVCHYDVCRNPHPVMLSTYMLCFILMSAMLCVFCVPL